FRDSRNRFVDQSRFSDSGFTLDDEHRVGRTALEIAMAAYRLFGVSPVWHGHIVGRQTGDGRTPTAEIHGIWGDAMCELLRYQSWISIGPRSQVSSAEHHRLERLRIDRTSPFAKILLPLLFGRH